MLFFFGKDCTQNLRRKRPEMRKVVEGFSRAKLAIRPMALQMQEHYDRKNSTKPSNFSPKKVSSSMGQVNSVQDDPHDSSSKTPTRDISAIESSPKFLIPDMSAIGETSSEFIQHLKKEDSKISASGLSKGQVDSSSTTGTSKTPTQTPMIPAILVNPNVNNADMVPAILQESCGAIPDISAILQPGGDDIDDEDTDPQYSSTGFESELSETSTEWSQSESIVLEGLPELSEHLSRMMTANIQEFSRSNIQK